MDLGLNGRVYVVTGGARGLGFATARELVRDGAKVVISGRDDTALAESVAALGGDEMARAVIVDNGDPDAGARLVETARNAFGGLHGAVLSGGGPPAGNVLKVTNDQWRDAFSSVFLGTLNIAQTVLAAIDDGAVALVLSSSVKSPIAGLAISNGLRPGLAMMAKSLADEVGPRGLRVVGLAPGRIATARTEALDAATAGRRAAGEAVIPLRRYGQPEEFGRVAAFVVSPAASYISGVVLSVDGGSMPCL